MELSTLHLNDRKTVDRLRYSVRNSEKNARSLTQIRNKNTSVEIAKAVQLRLIGKHQRVSEKNAIHVPFLAVVAAKTLAGSAR